MRIRSWILTLVVLLLAQWPCAVSAGSQGMPPLKPMATFRFDRYLVDYPKAYTPQPLNPRDPGGFFTQTNPFGFMFVVMSRRDEDTVIPQGRSLASTMLNRLALGNRIKSQTVTDIPADQLPPRTTLGKSLDAMTEQGLKMHAGFYLMEIDGRKVLVGYVTLTAENVKEDLRHLLTPYPDDVVQDFNQMIASLRPAY